MGYGARTLSIVVTAAVLGTALPLMAPTMAAAQAGKAGAAKKLKAGEVEEITVTAQRREENIQETPVSVTAVTSTMIEEKGITDVQGVAQYTPGVQMHINSGTTTGVTVNIRGTVTTDPVPTLDPTVGIYRDGVYIPRSMGALFDLPDLERIEVLRGPQGTLYGRNTAGGAINLVTKKPTDRYSVTGLVSAGDYDAVRSYATLNAPIIGENGAAEVEALGKLNARATVGYRYRDGFYRNKGQGSEDFDSLDRQVVTGTLRWEPSDRLTVDYNFDYTRAREEPVASQLSGIRAGGPTTFLAPYLQVHRADYVINNKLLDAEPGVIHDIGGDVDVRGHSLTGAYDAGDLGPMGNLTVKTILAYRSFDENHMQDIDGSDMHVFDGSSRDNDEQKSAEMQLLGSAPRVEYILGLYYFAEEGNDESHQLIFGGTAGQTGVISTSGLDNWSLAPFGQATYTPPLLDDKLSLTAGLRWTNDHKKTIRDYNCVVARGAPCDAADMKATAERSFDDFTPMGNIAYQLTDDHMTYFKVARGFKSGGFNGRATTLDTFEDPFESETLTAYELGFKTEWLDNRLRMNAAGFYSDYEDLQVTVFRADPLRGSVTTVENAASAEIWGTEIEGTAVPIEGVEARIGYGLLRPAYKEFCEKRNPATGQCEPGFDVRDKRDFPQAPEHKITAGLGYSAPVTSDGVTFSAFLDCYWQTGVVFALKDNDLNGQGSYTLLDGRVQLTRIPLQHGTVDIAAWGKNLTDKMYRTFGIDFGALGYSTNNYGNPRTLGVELVYRWEQS